MTKFLLFLLSAIGVSASDSEVSPKKILISFDDKVVEIPDTDHNVELLKDFTEFADKAPERDPTSASSSQPITICIR